MLFLILRKFQGREPPLQYSPTQFRVSCHIGDLQFFAVVDSSELLVCWASVENVLNCFFFLTADFANRVYFLIKSMSVRSEFYSVTSS